MDQNKMTPQVSEQDDQAYQWLEECTGLIASLKLDQSPELYSSTLLKMAFEGQKQLALVSSEDAVLVSYLNLLVAEVLVDLALVEKGASTRKMFLSEGYEYCMQAVSILEDQGISGLACSALPRALTILSAGYKAANEDQRPALEANLKKVSDLLDEFRVKQAYDRKKAVGKLLDGRVLALSTAEVTNPADRRQVLEKAAAFLRQASGLSGLAFDDNLARQAEETLAAVEKSLAKKDLPVPVLPLPPAPPEPEALSDEAVEMKLRPWLLGIDSGPLNGQRFPLGEHLRIGRALDNDLVLTDWQVSRKHASIDKVGEGYEITDLHSGNGTKVNGELIKEPVELKPGDLLQFGETRITVLGPAGTAPLPMDNELTLQAARTPEGETPLPAPGQSASRVCHHCGAPLRPASHFCGNCGYPVPITLKEVEPQEEAHSGPRCPNCGEPIRQGVKYCRKCGSKL